MMFQKQITYTTQGKNICFVRFLKKQSQLFNFLTYLFLLLTNNYTMNIPSPAEALVLLQQENYKKQVQISGSRYERCLNKYISDFNAWLKKGKHFPVEIKVVDFYYCSTYDKQAFNDFKDALVACMQNITLSMNERNTKII